MPESRGSLCPRYRRATETLKEAEGSISPEEAMALLEEVSQSGAYPTIWSVVYNMTSGEIQVVVGRECEQVYQFALKMGYE